MRFLFFSVLAAALAIVGYQLIRMDPLPIRVSSGGGAEVPASNVRAIAEVSASASTPVGANPPEKDEIAKWLSSQSEEPEARRTSEVRIITKPLRYKTRGFLGSESEPGEEAPGAALHVTGAQNGSPASTSADAATPDTVSSQVPPRDDVAGDSAGKAITGDELPVVVRIDAAPDAAAPADTTAASGDDPVVTPRRAMGETRVARATTTRVVPIPTQAPVIDEMRMARAVVPPLPEWSGRPPVARVALRDTTAPAGPAVARTSDRSVEPLRERKRKAVQPRRSKPLFKYRTHCHPAYGCERVLYARKPRNAKEARRIRKMRNRIMARRIQRYGY